MSQLKVTYLPIAAVRVSSRNARAHDKSQIDKLRASLREFGFTRPLLVDEAGVVLAGHGIFEAAKQEHFEEVPTVCLADMTKAQKRAYAIADNKLAELSTWDQKLLALEFKDLIEIDPDFDVTATGFETAEVDLLVVPDTSEEDPADRLPDDESGAPPVTQAGDVWQLGQHRLLCSDATDPESFRCLMGEERARVVFVDPPYNVAIDGHVGGRGSIHHREFAMASGDMSDEEFVAFLQKALTLLCRYTMDGSLHYVCMDWRHARHLLTAADSAYTELTNLCVWVKSNAGMGSFYRSRHELVFVFKHGTRPHVNNVRLGRHGRSRANVWEYAGANSFGAGREELALHPTVKPVQLVADAILDCSRRGETVLDCFAGSGTTAIACERTGRQARLIEIDPAYCDTIVRRWEQFTGGHARHVQTGLSFEEHAAERRGRAETSATPTP